MKRCFLIAKCKHREVLPRGPHLFQGEEEVQKRCPGKKAEIQRRAPGSQRSSKGHGVTFPAGSRNKPADGNCCRLQIFTLCFLPRLCLSHPRSLGSHNNRLPKRQREAASRCLKQRTRRHEEICEVRRNFLGEFECF